MAAIVIQDWKNNCNQEGFQQEGSPIETTLLVNRGGFINGIWEWGLPRPAIDHIKMRECEGKVKGAEEVGGEKNARPNRMLRFV